MVKSKGKGGNAHSNHYGKKQPPTLPAKPETKAIAPAQPPALTMAPTTPVTAPQTLQQQRAKHALEQVQAALNGGVNRKEFKSYASNLPAMIQMNGLGQAAAFYFSQGETYRKLYDILSGWLTQADQPYAGKEHLLAGITQQDMHAYRVAQAEALLLLDWVKRFAKAYEREE